MNPFSWISSAAAEFDVLTAGLLLLGFALLVLVVAERGLRQLPFSSALIYLGLGWLAGYALGAPSTQALVGDAALLVVITEVAVLVSLLRWAFGCACRRRGAHGRPRCCWQGRAWR